LRGLTAALKETPMAITVRIPTPLRTLTAGADEVSIDGSTVGEVIENLEKKHPGLKERLCDEKGVRRFVNVYANEEDIRFLDNLKTALKDGDSVSIVPAIAGG
jgi:molybdopterin synthase sulfur carrier subunit